MSIGGSRRDRVAQALRDNLAEMVGRDVKDPRVQAVGLVSVNHVELNRDMSVAHVYVSFYGVDDAAAAKAIKGLQGAANYLRGPLARRINLARAPQLRFVHDTSPEFKQRLSEIVADDAERAETEPEARRDPDSDE